MIKALQWHYRILQALALEEDLPEKPEDKTIPKYRQIGKVLVLSLPLPFPFFSPVHFPFSIVIFLHFPVKSEPIPRQCELIRGK